MTKSTTRAIILAAGRGSRMKDMTDEMPKCMVKFKNKSLLQWQLDALSGAGISEIAVVCGYKKEKISHPKITRFFENEKWQITNMVYTLFCADVWLSSSECIVSYSDIFYGKEIIKSLKQDSADLAITYDVNFAWLWQKRFSNPLSDVESFKIDENNFLTEIGSKVQTLEEVEGQYMGLLKFNPESWGNLKLVLKNSDIEKMDSTSMLQILIQNGIKIKAVPIKEMWGEVDSASDLELYEKIY